MKWTVEGTEWSWLPLQYHSSRNERHDPDYSELRQRGFLRRFGAGSWKRIYTLFSIEATTNAFTCRSTAWQNLVISSLVPCSFSSAPCFCLLGVLVDCVIAAEEGSVFVCRSRFESSRTYDRHIEWIRFGIIIWRGRALISRTESSSSESKFWYSSMHMFFRTPSESELHDRFNRRQIVRGTGGGIHKIYSLSAHI